MDDIVCQLTTIDNHVRTLLTNIIQHPVNTNEQVFEQYIRFHHERQKRINPKLMRAMAILNRVNVLNYWKFFDIQKAILKQADPKKDPNRDFISDEKDPVMSVQIEYNDLVDRFTKESLILRRDQYINEYVALITDSDEQQLVRTQLINLDPINVGKLSGINGIIYENKLSVICSMYVCAVKSCIIEKYSNKDSEALANDVATIVKSLYASFKDLEPNFSNDLKLVNTKLEEGKDVAELLNEYKQNYIEFGNSVYLAANKAIASYNIEAIPGVVIKRDAEITSDAFRAFEVDTLILDTVPTNGRYIVRGLCEMKSNPGDLGHGISVKSHMLKCKSVCYINDKPIDLSIFKEESIATIIGGSSVKSLIIKNIYMIIPPNKNAGTGWNDYAIIDAISKPAYSNIDQLFKNNKQIKPPNKNAGTGLNDNAIIDAISKPAPNNINQLFKNNNPIKRLQKTIIKSNRFGNNKLSTYEYLMFIKECIALSTTNHSILDYVNIIIG
jgi:hypothetical protein